MISQLCSHIEPVKNSPVIIVWYCEANKFTIHKIHVKWLKTNDLVLCTCISNYNWVLDFQGHNSMYLNSHNLQHF